MLDNNIEICYNIDTKRAEHTSLVLPEGCSWDAQYRKMPQKREEPFANALYKKDWCATIN